jgi:hypothetical protein
MVLGEIIYYLSSNKKIMIGTIVNTAAVAAGGIIGILLKKKMPERVTSIYFQAIGLFTMAIGMSMAVKMEHILIVVASLALGSLLGEWMNIENRVNSLGENFKQRFRIGSEQFSEGLTTAFLLFCVGSMTILGTIQEGTGGSPDLLYTKSLMDFFSSMLLASAFGVSVALSAIPLFIFQASLTLIAMFAGSFFTPGIILELTSVGGILLVGLGLNILHISNLRVMNMLPALVVVVIMLVIFA